MDDLGRVVIVGGGVGGLTLALALHRAGFTAEVYEQHDTFQRRATGFTIWSYAVGRLESLGVSLEHAGLPVEYTEIRNQSGRLISKMPVGEVSRKLGAASYEMRRSGMLEAIAAELPGDTLQMGSACVGLREHAEQVEVLLEGGETVFADLVVGADGIHSLLRKEVAGDIPLHYSGYSGAGGVTAFVHPDIPPQTHVDIWGHGGKAGIADIGEGEMRWYITWRGVAGSHHTKVELLDLLENWYPPVREVALVTPEEEIQQISYFDIAPLRQWTRGRMVLIGDAAHATTPFAAMGANMAIEDAMELTESIKQAEDLAAAFAAFESSRKKRTEQIVKRGRVMSRLTQLHSPFAAWLRDQAFLHMPAAETEKVTREMASGE
jgi:2-polyprenyl-6-methoxyphenol hydroxylase-like FAD-dependent oxidoreductase